MSELRIALIAEGPTDYEVINAALQAILHRPFILTPLQPEKTRPEFGSGWGGVLKWCHQAEKSGCASLDSYPPLSGFDVVILHADADVASKSYKDCGLAVEDIAARKGWGLLPCAASCPPPLPTVERLEQTIIGWLGSAGKGTKVVFCIPSKSTGTWLAAACFPSTHPILRGGECDLTLEDRLSNLKLEERIKKTTVTYREKAPLVKNNWDKVRFECSSAMRFESLILSLFSI
jgi:hypothetical protein